MSAQHTPGPLRTAMSKRSDAVAVVTADGCVVAECWADIRRPYEKAVDEAAANATLYAAATDMLETLEMARNYLRSGHFDQGNRHAVAFAIETAIAKATGSAS